MVEVEKKSRSDVVFTRKEKELKERSPRLAYLTSLPNLTKLLDNESLPNVVTPLAMDSSSVLT